MLTKIRDLLTIGEHKILLFIVSIISISKATLIGNGLMYFPDESRYFQSLLAVKDIFEGKITGAIIALNSTQGRPGDAVFRLFPAAIQAALFKVKGINVITAESLVVNSWLNLLVVLVNSYVFWRLAREVLARNIALLALLLYIGLTSSNLYIRHVLPYDEAICLLLLSLLLICKAIKQEHQRRWIVLAGFAAGLCYATYPGYFMAPLFLGLTVLVYGVKHYTWRRTFEQLVLLGAGFIAIVAGFEGVARLGGTSYLLASQTLSTTITQGDFSAGFSFLPEYLFVVEKVTGVVLAILFLLSVYKVLLRREDNEESKTQFETSMQLGLIIATVGCWLLYAVSSFVLHKIVFYGRIVHFFMPSIVLIGIGGLSIFNRYSYFIFAKYAVILIVAISFANFYINYKPLKYSSDVLSKYGIYSPLPKDAKVLYNTDSKENGAKPVIFKTLHVGPPVQSKFYKGLVLINTGYIYPIASYRNIKVPGKLIAECPATVEYVPYSYEGYMETERKVVATHNYVFQIYAQP